MTTSPPRPTSSHLVRDEVPTSPRDLVPSPPSLTGGTRSAGRGEVAGSALTSSQDQKAPHAYQHPGSLERPATLHACRRCDRPVLRAVVDGFDVVADPWVLTAAGELAARIQTRDVFTGYCDAQLVLAFRFARHVQGEKGRPVFASHSCTAAPIEFDLDATRAIAEMFAPPIQTTEEEEWA